MSKISQLVIGLTALISASVNAAPVTINYTADNTILDFGVCLNLGCNPLSNPSDFSLLLDKGANVNNWTNADSITFDLDPGTYSIGFVVQNFGAPSRGNPAGLLAEIIWQDNINLTSSTWDVTTNGVDYVAATEWHKNGAGVWGSNLLGEISSDAYWLWTANNFDGTTDTTAAFRTTITVRDVSEPGIFGLFLLGLASLGLRRRLG
ncbi:MULTISPECIES: PEP-CTERM sorting domain-containing protein [Corallincola]|uniref:PEP-CTERM sorting domain-containing protein n=3 Tax=Corallincola TaxID=1775176 RepID=A0A368N5D0_9GAMM|nr:MULTISPECIES: PEP-CTERM sorting domain-containing protein [Corallincola]RCU45223.1 PEP-CTERM sorting domain-containing protein [Corallincola holothuriorum]TAA43612.1 PEP-CTERM sorting domain-containing protein [Corallincola spongiicola]TCI02864.1 PEP-CTERM sorting domain-containing protein [Corallincola luteus]